MGDRKRELSRAALNVLASFMREPAEPHYGLQLISDCGVKAGSLYPILQRFEDDGWIEGTWEEVDPREEKRPRRRYYRLTGLGQQAAREELRRATSGLTVGVLGWSS
jgi:DNA-binding PadR family transcriptional regulator